MHHILDFVYIKIASYDEWPDTKKREMMEKKPTQPSVRRSTSVYFQLACIVISSLFIGILTLKALAGFVSFDEPPQLLPITPERVIAFGGTPATVKVGLTITNFSVFDIIKNEFVFTGTIWFEFDPSITSLETIKQFTFEKGEVLAISEPTTKIIGENLFASYDIRIRKRENLTYSYFPFSAHTFNVILDNRASPGEIVYKSSAADLVVSPEAIPSGWRLTDEHVFTGYSTSALEEVNKDKAIFHPRVVFAMDFNLQSLRHLLTILLPLILMFYITTFSFSMDPEYYYRSIISLSIGGVTAMLAYRFVIENLSPKVGYFMLSDSLFFLFLTACCGIFLINTKTLELNNRSKQLATLLLHVFVVGGMFALFTYWRP